MPQSGRIEPGKLTSPHPDRIDLPILRVRVTSPRGRVAEATAGIAPLVVGTDPGCDLAVDDPRVSRRHCEISLTDRGIVLRDLGSKNGILTGTLQIVEALLTPGVEVQIGSSRLVCIIGEGSKTVPLSTAARFGDVFGASVPMRALFARLEAAAPGEAPVLLVGERGTEKELLARAVHARSARRDGSFVMFDCRGAPQAAVEAELFGQGKGGAGAHGLLGKARDGTLYIAAIEELPDAAQPKLLRALSPRGRHLGFDMVPRPSRARVVAAASPDLRARVAAGSFNKELYDKLADNEAVVPPLRDRRDDIRPLVQRLLAGMHPKRTWSDLPANSLELLVEHTWPGNVRELYDMVARLALPPQGSSIER